MFRGGFVGLSGIRVCSKLGFVCWSECPRVCELTID